MDVPEKELWNIKDIARYLSVSVEKVEAMRHRPREDWPSPMRMNRTYYWKREDIIEWAEDQNDPPEA